MTNLWRLQWELVKGPDLLDLLNIAHNKKLPEPKVAHYFQQLINAVIFMHNNGFCHRDLKAENCVVDTASQCVKVSWISYSAWSALLCSLRISEASHHWLCHLAHNLCVTLLHWTQFIAFGCCCCRGNEPLPCHQLLAFDAFLSSLLLSVELVSLYCCATCAFLHAS